MARAADWRGTFVPREWNAQLTAVAVPTKHSLAPVGTIWVFILAYLSFPPMLYLYAFVVVFLFFRCYSILLICFSFRSVKAWHYFFAPAHVLVHARWGVCMYNIMSFALLTALKCECVLKSQLFRNFFLEIFGGMENSLYFCTRFWEIHFLKANKERVLWKILHKQTSSTRSGLTYTLLYIRAEVRLGKRNEPSSNWQVRFSKLQ